MHVIAAKAVAFHRGEPAVVPPVRAAATSSATPSARRRAHGRRVPHRLRRHRQPPDARRPASVRCDRQGRAGGARPRRDHVQQERDPQRSGEAVRHERPAARHRVGHDGGHGRPEQMREIAALIGLVARSRRQGWRTEAREQANRLCSKFTPYPNRVTRCGRTAQREGLFRRLRGCARDDLRSRRSCAGSRNVSGGGGAVRRTPASAHEGDADAGRRGDVRRLPRRDGGRVADGPVPRDVRRQLRSRSACCSARASCS